MDKRVSESPSPLIILGSLKVENLFLPPTALLFEFVLYFLTRYWTDRSSIKTESIVQYFLEDIKVIKGT